MFNNNKRRSSKQSNNIKCFTIIKVLIVISIPLISFTNIYTFHSKYAPSFFTTRNNLPLINIRQTCHQTYFWGGGKSGSSSLYFMLADKQGGELSPFVKTGFKSVGKEPCYPSKEFEKWKELVEDKDICSIVNSEQRFTHMLNGCPRHTRIKSAKRIMDISNNNTMFLMLIRDPVDRLVSHLNDECRRGGKNIDVEKRALRLGKTLNMSKPNIYMSLSLQGLALKNLLSVIKDPNKVLIIPMESLTIDHQGVVDAVMDHIHSPRWVLNQNEASRRHSNKASSGSYNYTNLSNSTRDFLRAKLKEDVLLLERLVGKQFSWSAWARENNTEIFKLNNENDKISYNDLINDIICSIKLFQFLPLVDKFCTKNDEFWLATTPNPQIDIASL